MKRSGNFIERIIDDDLKQDYSADVLRFRFPPEPNGYLHIGHVKAICLNFNLGLRYKAPVNLRFDDTNPTKEEQQFVDAIKENIEWLGYKWDSECYASDYFEQLFDWAVNLISQGKAYVDSQTSEQIAKQKGTPTKPGINSPFRERTIDQNKELFIQMKEGKFKSTLNETLPPEGLSMPLDALWWQHQGNWERAHSLAQSCSNKDAAWVHALLHREEGDLSNANYWYKRANREPYSGAIKDEWRYIVKALCR